MIKTGHFRFSMVGEEVLRLEERLGYVHKGIEKRFESFSHWRRTGSPRACPAIPPSRGRGPTAWRWNRCRREPAAARRVAARARAQRERIANHLGDLGALGNDAGFALGLAHSRA